MPGCLSCPVSDSTTIEGVWEDYRDHLGPITDSMSTEYRASLYAEDLSYYVEWADAHGVISPLDNSNYRVFSKWFAWKLTIGSNSGGNLPVRLREHVGISCAPCPYDSNCDDIRAEIMVGSVPAVQTDHGIYYMKVDSRGSKWGFGCTYSGCPYLLDTGKNYFYV